MINEAVKVAGFRGGFLPNATTVREDLQSIKNGRPGKLIAQHPPYTRIFQGSLEGGSATQTAHETRAQRSLHHGYAWKQQR